MKKIDVIEKENELGRFEFLRGFSSFAFVFNFFTVGLISKYGITIFALTALSICGFVALFLTCYCSCEVEKIEDEIKQYYLMQVIIELTNSINQLAVAAAQVNPPKFKEGGNVNPNIDLSLRKQDSITESKTGSFEVLESRKRITVPYTIKDNTIELWEDLIRQNKNEKNGK